MRALQLAALCAGLAILSGCALKSDLVATNNELEFLKAQQEKTRRQTLQEMDKRSQMLERDQSDLSTTQSEFKNDVRTLSNAVSTLNNRMAALESTTDALAKRIRELQQTQAVGMGALSRRVDENSAKLAGASGKLDKFGNQVSTEVDAHSTQLAELSRNVDQMNTRSTKSDKDLADLSVRLDALGKKLTSELQKVSKGQEKGGGAGGGDETLRRRVDFLGKKLAPEVDAQAKDIAALGQRMKDIEQLLTDLNQRLKTIEKK